MSVQDPRITELMALAAEQGQRPAQICAPEDSGWLPWVLVAAFAAVGGSATALLFLVAMGTF